MRDGEHEKSGGGGSGGGSGLGSWSRPVVPDACFKQGCDLLFASVSRITPKKTQNYIKMKNFKKKIQNEIASLGNQFLSTLNTIKYRLKLGEFWHKMKSTFIY